jgi:uncharacterized membrane protein
MVRVTLFIVICIFCVVSVYALDFGTISPPDMPSSGLINANTSTLTIALKDPAGVQVHNAHIYTSIKNAVYEKKTLEYTESGNITLYLPKGIYSIEMRGDALETPGGDYYYEGTLNVDNDAQISIHFFPVGSLRGTVINGNTIIPNALVKFVCSKSYGSLEETQTDTYGSFSNDYLPIGECRVHARLNDRIGYADVTIKPGTVTTLELNLSKQTAKDSNYLIFAGIGMFLLIIIVVFFKLKPQQLTQELPKPMESSRSKDLMSTLNEKEKQVVSLLVEKGELYQNKIVYETNIPKTSLVRILTSLEQKHIIESKQIGKTKKFKPTNWFLNTEKTAK